MKKIVSEQLSMKYEDHAKILLKGDKLFKIMLLCHFEKHY